MKFANRQYVQTAESVPALRPTEDHRKAVEWGRKHPSPFRRRTRKERGLK